MPFRLPLTKARWLVLALGPFAGLIWARAIVLPTLMMLSFSAALLGVYAVGWLVQERLGPIPAGADNAEILSARVELPNAAARPGVFQILWLGQFAVFGLALCVGVLAALFAALTGVHLPLRLLMPLALVGLWSLRLRRAKGGASWPALSPTLAQLLLAGLIGLALFRALVLHGSHAGALGYDTQQHIYWTQHIADYGYVPLAARDTDVLESYPRLFHLLAASWSALGLTSIVGPYVKIMPFLQSALACGLFCELVLGLSEDRRIASADTLKALALAAFVCWHLTYGDGEDVIRAKDLSGTPRYSSGWVLYAGPLLALAQCAGTLRDVRPLLVAAAPISFALALGINPVVAALLASFSVPVTLVLALATRADYPGGPFGFWRSAAAGMLGSAWLVASNPFVLEQFAAQPSFAGLFAALGLRTHLAGRQAEAWTGVAVATHELCSGGAVDCVWDVGSSVAAEVGTTLASVYTDGNATALSALGHPAVYWSVFCLPLLVMAIRSAGQLDSVDVAPARARSFLALLSSVALSMVPLEAVRAALGQLSHSGPMLRLLSGYYARLDMFLPPFVLCMLGLASWPLVSFRALRGRPLFVGTAGTAIALFGMLHTFRPAGVVKHRMSLVGARIDWPELRAIELLNRFVPANESILVPAHHVLRHNYEHLMVADDATGMIVSHLRGRFLFGLSIGAGIDYGWADLVEDFCATASARNELLRTTNTHWVLLRDPNPSARATYDAMKWECGVTLRDLGAEYPPVFVERDLALFRIHPEGALNHASSLGVPAGPVHGGGGPPPPGDAPSP